MFSILIFRIGILVFFLSDGQQRVVYNNSFFGEWKDVNKGMIQESVIVFLNDLKVQLEGVDILFKYVDDTNIVIPLWKDGVDQWWAIFDVGLKKTPCHVILERAKNSPGVKKVFVEELYKINNIPQCSELRL